MVVIEILEEREGEGERLIQETELLHIVMGITRIGGIITDSKEKGTERDDRVGERVSTDVNVKDTLAREDTVVDQTLEADHVLSHLEYDSVCCPNHFV